MYDKNHVYVKSINFYGLTQASDKKKKKNTTVDKMEANTDFLFFFVRNDS